MTATLGRPTTGEALAEASARLGAAVVSFDPSLVLRAELASDQSALIALYTEFRWAEMAQTNWPESAIREFLAEQFLHQANHYVQHYAGAHFMVLADHEGQVLGRIYLYRSPTEYRLMDIMLFERCRGRGLGRALIDALIRVADDQQTKITLHVERENPARQFYQRRGFGLVEDRGVYDFLQYPAPGS